MRRRDLLAGLSLVPLAAPAVAQCVLPGFPRSNRPGRCEAASVGPVPDIALDFMQPGLLDPRITFTRASTGTYFNSAGVLQTAAVDAPRWDHNPSTLQLRGLLIEDARTNLLLNSATLGTQSVAVTAQVYALSFYGTGTITKSGTATGALVGAGATQRVSQTFTPTSGSLTLTVSGSVTNAQLEAGSFPTSYITTAGASALRAADNMAMTGAGFSSWFNAAAGSFVVEASYPAIVPLAHIGRFIELSDGTTSNFLALIAAYTGGQLNVSSTIAGVAGTTLFPIVGSPVVDYPVRGGVTYGTQRTATGKAAPGGMGSVVSTPGGIAPLINQLGIGNRWDGIRAFGGHMRSVRYWSRALSDADLQAIVNA